MALKFEGSFFSRHIFLMFMGFFIGSCSLIESRDQEKIKAGKRAYSYADSTGKYEIFKEVGELKNKKALYTKTKLVPDDGSESEGDDKNFVEKNFAVSTLDNIEFDSKKIAILRPYASQYEAWFEGKKYFSQLKLDFKKSNLQVTSFGGEKKEKIVKEIELPSNKGVYCFYSQIEECIRMTGFLDLSREKKSGKMSFYVVIDSYPYFVQQFDGVPQKAIIPASFNYEESYSNGDVRYSLKFAEQMIFYHFDKKDEFIKKNWVSQGLSIQKNKDEVL